MVGVGILQRRHPISKAFWDIGVRDSEQGSKTSHLASSGKTMHKNTGVRGALQVGGSNRSLVSRANRDLKDRSLLEIVNEEYCGSILSNISAYKSPN